jgi:hypothetical protein
MPRYVLSSQPSMSERPWRRRRTPAASPLCCSLPTPITRRACPGRLINIHDRQRFGLFRAQSVAACRSAPGWRILALMGTKSRESIYGSSVRHSAERAAEARKEADRLACIAWNQRMLGFKGPAQPSPSLGDALNARYLYLEVRCLGCDTHQTVALNIVRRPKATPIHELERYMRCKDCSQVRGYPYKRSHLVALRPSNISALDPPSTSWPGER